MEEKTKKSMGKKLVAPVIITVLVGAYLLFLALIFLLVPGMPLLVKLLLSMFFLGFAGVMIYVLVERVKEIRSGEEDDLSKY